MSVTLPTVPRPIRGVARYLDQGTDLPAAVGAATQRSARAGNRHAVDFTYPTFDIECAEAFAAALDKSRATVTTVVANWPQQARTIYGTPLVKNAGQTGLSLVSDGWTYTNRALWSEDFSNAAYSDISTGVTTVTANVARGPTGRLNADKLTGTHANTWWTQSVGTGHASTTKTLSVWLCAEVPYTAQLVMSFNGGNSYTKNVAVQRGWNRFEFTQTFVGGDTQALRVGINHGLSHITYAWGLQLELASAASTYHKTTTGQIAVPAGAYFSVTVSSKVYLYKLTDDAVMNSSGEATLALDCMLRASPADNAALNFTQPQIEGWLAGAAELSIERLTRAKFPVISIEEAA